MAKRFFDIAVASIALIVLGPVMLCIGMLVRIRMGSPILYCQLRPGLKGQPFRIRKFRTMTDARDSHGNLLPDSMRLTRFGKWLRATSLDELPELLNVLEGTMSLVGPRPLLMRYLDRYTDEEARRHEVRPGLTGWAQVNGRNAISWEQKLSYDVWYVDHRSFWIDLRILLKTVIQVLKRDGIQRDGHATVPEFGTEPESPRGLAVIGAGGHSKVVIETLRATGREPTGVYDDEPKLWGQRLMGIPIVGPIQTIEKQPNRPAILAIGDSAKRENLAQQLSCRWQTVVHPSATIANNVQIGPGSIVMAGAIVQPSVVIGRHSIINTGASIDHDGKVGDFAHICPGVRLAGHVHVGDRSTCGIGSTVMPQVRIGADATLGAGAVAVANVESGTVVVGVPARLLSRTDDQKEVHRTESISRAA